MSPGNGPPRKSKMCLLPAGHRNVWADMYTSPSTENSAPGPVVEIVTPVPCPNNADPAKTRTIGDK